MRINFLNCAYYEKDVGCNKEIVEKYVPYYQTFKLLTYLGHCSCIKYVECAKSCCFLPGLEYSFMHHNACDFNSHLIYQIKIKSFIILILLH